MVVRLMLILLLGVGFAFNGFTQTDPEGDYNKSEESSAEFNKTEMFEDQTESYQEDFDRQNEINTEQINEPEVIVPEESDDPVTTFPGEDANLKEIPPEESVEPEVLLPEEEMNYSEESEDLEIPEKEVPEEPYESDLPDRVEPDNSRVEPPEGSEEPGVYLPDVDPDEEIYIPEDSENLGKIPEEVPGEPDVKLPEEPVEQDLPGPDSSIIDDSADVPDPGIGKTPPVKSGKSGKGSDGNRNLPVDTSEPEQAHPVDSGERSAISENQMASKDTVLEESGKQEKNHSNVSIDGSVNIQNNYNSSKDKAPGKSPENKKPVKQKDKKEDKKQAKRRDQKAIVNTPEKKCSCTRSNMQKGKAYSHGVTNNIYVNTPVWAQIVDRKGKPEPHGNYLMIKNTGDCPVEWASAAAGESRFRIIEAGETEMVPLSVGPGPSSRQGEEADITVRYCDRS